MLIGSVSLEVRRYKDSVEFRATIGSAGIIWILMFLPTMFFLMGELYVIALIYMAVFAGSILWKHEKVEYLFDIPARCIHWKRRGYFKSRFGDIPFSDVEAIELKVFPNLLILKDSYPVSTAGFYLHRSHSRVAMISGGLRLKEARKHFLVLKEYLPMISLSEMEAGTSS